MKQAQAVNSAAFRFLESLGERPFPPEAIDCAKAAFLLYEQAWDCHTHHISAWAWPIEEAKRHGKFEGDQPWTILLRRAVELVRKSNTKAKA